MEPISAVVRRIAWYHKDRPTFAAALALVRRAIWAQPAFGPLAGEADLVTIPRALVERCTDARCYAA